MFLKDNRFHGSHRHQNSLRVWDVVSWQSAYLAFVKPWVQPLAQYDVLACHPSISKVDSGDLKLNTIVSYKVSLRLTLAT